MASQDERSGLAPELSEDILLPQLDRVSTAIWVFDLDRNRVVWANEAALKAWKAPSLEELRARDLSTDMSQTVARRLKQYQNDFEKSDISFSEIWTLYPEGIPTTMEVVYRGLRLADGRMAMLCEGKVNYDIQPESLRSAEALLHTPVMISLFSDTGEPLYRNPASRASQIDPDTTLHNRLVEKGIAERLMASLRQGLDCRVVAQTRTAHGIRWHELTARSCQDAATGVPAFLVSEIDVTELKETEERAQYLAEHDFLTGLPSRAHLQTYLPRLIRDAKTNGYRLYFYLMDLDKFKEVNDTLGHLTGDHLLKSVASKLSAFVGERGMVARLGGDEFLICIPERTNRPNAQEFGRQILDLFVDPIDISGHALQVTLSVGLSICPDDGDDLDTLMRHSDLALYEAKSHHTNKCTQFSMDLRERLEEKITLEKDLWQALQNNEFEIFYQPRVSVETGRIAAAEALIRWRHPERGLLGPDKFIPACEETGMIIDVGEWVYRTVASQQRQMKEAGIDIALSINLSPRQFSDPELVEKLLRLPEETGCDPHKLGLEITESVLLGDSASVRDALHRLKQKGYIILIDDFGTGYSNLAYLQKYPIDIIKIDQTFLKSLETSAPIARLIISLGGILNVRIVAEGVETPEQLEWLAANDCDEYQGFYFSKPIPYDDLLALYRETTPEISACPWCPSF